MSRARAANAPLFWRLGDAARPTGPHVALAPGAEVPLLALDLPDRLRGLARERVAARLLGQALGTPLEGLEIHPFVPGGRGAPWRSAMVVDAEAAARWRGALRPGCIALLPDYLGLPCAPEVWTVQIAGGQMMARIGVGDGFSAEPALALRLLAQAHAAAPPRAILRLGSAEPALDAYLNGLDIPVHGDLAALAGAGIRPLRWTEASCGVDLKDPPSALYDRLRAGLRMWRLPVAFFGLALAAYLGTLWLETRQLRADQARDAAVTLDLVRRHFVPAGPILDVRAQVAQVVAEAAAPVAAVRADLPPLTLFQMAAPMLTGDRLELQVVEYRGDSGLVAVVNAQDFSALDLLVADLRGGALLVEVLDQRSLPSGGVTARLRLQAEPGQ